MPSKLSLIGLIVLILGSTFLVLFTFLLPQFNIGLPLVSGTGKSSNLITVNSGQSERINLGVVSGHPLWVSVRVVFILQDQNDYDCTVTLIYDNADYPNQRISNSFNYVEYSDKSYITKTITATIMPPASSSTYNLYLDVDNDGGDIRVGDRMVLVTYSLFATIFPALIAIAGLIITIVGFVMGRGPSVPKARPAPGGWEPTLQWGGGAAAKQPKMAIKSTTAPPKQVKKVVKKAAPGGVQQSCKFCGKPVPASAYFCPHCYGKLR